VNPEIKLMKEFEIEIMKLSAITGLFLGLYDPYEVMTPILTLRLKNICPIASVQIADLVNLSPISVPSSPVK